VSGVDAAVVRALVAGLPSTEERSHHHHPDFRVDGRIFATLNESEDHAALRLTSEEANALAQAREEFRLVSDSRGYGWVRVELARIEREELRELLKEAWQLRAGPPG
jgi:hypothetical protein